MKEKMIEYSKSVKWKEFSGNSPYENKQIQDFINNFFNQYQPERLSEKTSKEEAIV